ncbi:hypothetical protein [Spirosoma sp. KUDC1026]|uniref:WapI family immunity protein n=1 Tax=Spirosoma sp. KUDC1026 TaxID=2745947 RepID=UPI00159BCABD|nr:hypothetical protein [Spirosoma sp. KUDC1026]QKZ12952.1 hypothetical protein HU175_10035 [Spirosoma sp. KUDC1026]
MKLTGYNSTFELNILDYECSDANSFMDRNWLLIGLKTQFQQQQTVCTAPLLSTWEVELLLNWMRSIADQRELSPRLTFVEPALVFSNTSRDKGDYCFQIRLSSDALPRWQSDKKAFYMPINVSKHELQQAIDDLDRQLKLFPVRD